MYTVKNETGTKTSHRAQYTQSAAKNEYLLKSFVLYGSGRTRWIYAQHAYHSI